MVGIDTPPEGCSDDGFDGGAEIGAPIGTEAADDLSVHGHGPQFSLRAVIVGRDLGMAQEGEEVIADGQITLSQAFAMAVVWGQGQDGVEIALQPAAIFKPGAFLQGEAAAGEDDGAQDQGFHAGREHAVAGLDGVAQVSELVSQANLPGIGMTALGAVEVRDPELGPVDRPARRGPPPGRATAG